MLQSGHFDSMLANATDIEGNFSVGSVLKQIKQLGTSFPALYGDSAPTILRSLEQLNAAQKFIPAEDLLVPYNATDLLSAERVTHVVSMSNNEVRKMQLSGFYADIDLNDSEQIIRDNIDKEIDKIQGVEPDYSDDEQRKLYEIHTVEDIEGFEDVDEMGETTGLKLPDRKSVV